MKAVANKGFSVVHLFKLSNFNNLKSCTTSNKSFNYCSPSTTYINCLVKNNIVQQVFSKHNISSHDAVRNYSTTTVIDTSISSDQTVASNQVLPKPTIRLNPEEYESWTKEQVCSLLYTEKKNGGASLSIEKVKPLFDAGFDGTSIGNIVSDLKSTNEEPIHEKKERIIDSTHKDFSNAPRATIKTVVNWVENLLKTNLFRLWPPDVLRTHLDRIGLSTDLFSIVEEKWYNTTLINSIFIDLVNGKDFQYVLERMQGDMNIDHESCKTILNWINSMILHTTLLEFEPISHLSSYMERLQNPKKFFGYIDLKTEWDTGAGSKTRPAPFVDRYNSILETIETMYGDVNVEKKPKFTLISTTMGMGKSSFLCFCIKQFLASKFFVFFKF